MTRSADLARLRGIVAALRAPDGCPWDREQDLTSMQRHLLEETYEVLDVMRDETPDAHCEELGDLLFQIVFGAQLREERGEFTLADVLDGISDKLERRHPHVFGDAQVADSSAVNAQWEALKRAEGKGGIEAIPRALPPLMRAEAVGKEAAKAGFDWSSVDGPLAKVAEELDEVRQAIANADQDAVTAEIGDLLFAVVNVARHARVSPALALDGATRRFEARYGHLSEAVAASGGAIRDHDERALDRLWADAKRAVG